MRAVAGKLLTTFTASALLLKRSTFPRCESATTVGQASTGVPPVGVTGQVAFWPAGE